MSISYLIQGLIQEAQEIPVMRGLTGSDRVPRRSSTPIHESFGRDVPLLDVYILPNWCVHSCNRAPIIDITVPTAQCHTRPANLERQLCFQIEALITDPFH